MKIVDAFLFSEPHEKEVFLLKLMLSDKYVDKWILCENAYTHQGDYKGLGARSLIQNDERFAPYRDKIVIIERERQFDIIDKTKIQDHLAFKAENWQRSLAYDYFIENYSDEDWIAINDVDEILDFSDEGRVAEFFTKLNQAAKEGVLQVPRIRFWFDFDNQFLRMHSSVLCTKAFLLANKDLTLSAIRNKFTGTPAQGWNNVILFEYSTCYDREHILRKLETNPHTGVSKQDLLQALKCNHRTIHGHMLKEKLRPTPHFFLETVELTRDNSPLYVRQNLSKLKTNVVDKNYKQNRRLEYPQFYTFYYPFVEKLNTEIANIKYKGKKKFTFLLKRLGLKK